MVLNLRLKAISDWGDANRIRFHAPKTQAFGKREFTSPHSDFLRCVCAENFELFGLDLSSYFGRYIECLAKNYAKNLGMRYCTPE